MRISSGRFMKTKLWRVSVTTSIEAEEAVAAHFENLFRQPPSVFVDATTPTATVSAYCPKLPLAEADLRLRLRNALAQVRACGLNIGSGRITTRKVTPENWKESWKKHFRPFEISRSLLVKPTWSRR